MTKDLQSTYSASYNPDQKPRIPQKFVWISVTVVSVVLLLLVGLIIWLAFAYPDRIEAMRDVFIMLFALTSCSAVVVLTMVFVALIRLINMIDYEIRPILEKTNETMVMVQETTNFVSKNVVEPTIKTTSFIAGIGRGFKVLFGPRKRNLPD